jgi:hypothetical protein
MAPIDIAVVQLVRHLIQRSPVQQPMRKIESRRVDKWHQKEQGDEHLGWGRGPLFCSVDFVEP